MAYSGIAILSFVVHLIINYDILLKKDKKTKYSNQWYRWFLYGVSLYYITDSLWGLLYEAKLITAIYTDTVIYYVAMSVSVFLWTRYVIHFLDEKNIFLKILSYFGWIYLIFDCLALIINFFTPIKFYFDSDCVYHASFIRYIAYVFQVLMFIITSVHVYLFAIHTQGKERQRHRTIGGFGIAMTLFVILQTIFPLLPFYSIGYLIGTCLIHTFVLEDEKEDYRKQLEEHISKENFQKLEINTTTKMAYTDSLTGVKNKRAFLEAQKEIQEAVNCGLINEFGIVVFDLNTLKQINDSKGHEAGDLYIKDASQIICNIYKHSPIYRIGGDEFVAFLRGEDYKNRELLLNNFEKKMEDNLKTNDVVISSGMDVYSSSQYDSFEEVFKHADKKMYERKKLLKGMI